MKNIFKDFPEIIDGIDTLFKDGLITYKEYTDSQQYLQKMLEDGKITVDQYKDAIDILNDEFDKSTDAVKKFINAQIKFHKTIGLQTNTQDKIRALFYGTGIDYTKIAGLGNIGNSLSRDDYIKLHGQLTELLVNSGKEYVDLYTALLEILDETYQATINAQKTISSIKSQINTAIMGEAKGTNDYISRINTALMPYGVNVGDFSILQEAFKDNKITASELENIYNYLSKIVEDSPEYAGVFQEIMSIILDAYNTSLNMKKTMYSGKISVLQTLGAEVPLEMQMQALGINPKDFSVLYGIVSDNQVSADEVAKAYNWLTKALPELPQ